MARKRGRPRGAGNFKFREADHQDCLAIARLRRAEPGISLWQAIFRVAGGDGGWKHQGARQRRLHRKYRSNERWYLHLVELADRPPPPVVSIVAMAQQIVDAWRPVIQAHEDLARLTRQITASLPKLPEYLVKGSGNIW